MNTNNIFSKLEKNDCGMDMRYSEEQTINLEKININLQKKKILKKLEDGDISIYEKILLIKDNHILEDSYSYNISAGGLMDDFNYNFNIKNILY